MPSPRTPLRLIPLSLALVVSTSAAAPSPQTEEVAIQGLRTVLTQDVKQQNALTRGAAWQSFVARNGRWSVIWNEATGSPRRAFGKGIPLDGFGPEAAQVDGAVRGFIASHPEFFGDAPQIQTVAAHRARNVWYVRYRQTLGGIPVLFSSWEFRVSPEGKLFAFGADVHRPGVELLSRPRIAAIVARESAKQGLSFSPATDRAEGGTQLHILPLRRGSQLEYRMVYDVRLYTRHPRGEWKALVDAGTGEVLWRSNQLMDTGPRDAVRRGPVAEAPRQPRVLEFESQSPMRPLAAITGKVTGRVHLVYPYDGISTRNFINENVRLDNTVTTATNTVGDYSLTCSATANISTSLTGPYFHVTSAACINCDAFFSQSTACPAVRNVLWDSSNSTDGERDAFYHSNIAHAYVKTIDPSYTASDQDIAIVVNSVDNECVAFWDEGSMIFGESGAECPYNMASLPDMVYRMYGMRVNEDLYFIQGSTFGITNEAVNRGSADAMAAFMTDDPKVGDGILGIGTFFRDISEDKRWPDDRSAEPNETGLILAGTFWDLRQSLGLAVAEQLLHFAKYGLPGEDPSEVLSDGDAMTEYFIETLVADDNDADISNGTPHFTQIVTAFNAHGIGTGNLLRIDHTALTDQPGNGPFPITAVIQYTGPIGSLDPGSPTLHYLVNGQGFVDVPMNPTGNPDEYGAEIPAQAGAIVRYYISAAESFGGMATSPGGAPARAENIFIAGPVTTILAHDMSTNPGWTIGAAGDAALGTWVRAEPVGTVAQPDFDHTELDDSLCFVTANAPVTEENPGTADVDDGRVTLTTSTFDAVAGGIVLPMVSYYRWFSNNAGDAPNEDPWRVFVSNNGGATWAMVENTTRTDQYWRRNVFFIKDYVTPTANMRMKFVATDTLSASLVEAALDDWALMAFPFPVSVDPAPAVRPLSLQPASPNPFTSGTHLRYSLPSAGPVEVSVFDIHGRQVRRLVRGTEEAGTHLVTWDGRDQDGRRVPSGPYFVRLSQGAQTSRQAVVRIQ